MTTEQKGPIPTEIKLHRKSRLLHITFANGREFSLPCEYLRVHSQGTNKRIPEAGKESVNIDHIEPQGAYAIRISFDDGHDTGIYSWQTLYDLGIHQEKNWRDYLERLARAGHRRDGDGSADSAQRERRIRVLYFAYLADRMHRESEELSVPPSVANVSQLLAWLRRIKGDRGYLLAENHVRVTVNRQFAEPFTRLETGDEVAVVPNSPNPPPAPRSGQSQDHS